MKRLLPSALAVVLLTAAEGADQSKKDLDQMQGNWAAESLVRDGKAFPQEEAQTYFRTVKGNTYTVVRFGKVVANGTMKLDATKSPKTIDFTPEGSKTAPMPGIYALDGETLTQCIAMPGKPRPTKLAADPGSGMTLMVWKREKK